MRTGRISAGFIPGRMSQRVLHSVVSEVGAPGGFAQRVLRFTHTDTVVVIHSFGSDVDAHFDAYEAAYEAAYAAYSKFILVFDARTLGCVPSADTRERKISLTARLKSQTTYKVPFVGVLVSNELFAGIISQLLRARGQAAPLLLTHDVHTLARDIVRAMYIADGVNPVSLSTFQTVSDSTTTLAQAGFPAVFVCTLVLYLKFMRHHLSRGQ